MRFSQLSAQVSTVAVPAAQQIRSTIQGDTSLPLAGFWRRLFAFGLDLVVLAVLGNLLIGLLIVQPLKAAFNRPAPAVQAQPVAEAQITNAPALTPHHAEMLLDLGEKIGENASVRRGVVRGGVALLQLLWEAAVGLFAFLLVTITLLVLLGYYAGFECSRLQATPGKLLLGLRVAGVNGQRLSYRRTSARNLGKLLFFPCSPLFLGYALFSKRRGMHHLFSGCKVILRGGSV